MPAWSNWVSSQWISTQFDQGVEFDWGLKLGRNSLKLHCMPAWSNWVSSQWISTQFDCGGGLNSTRGSNWVEIHRDDDHQIQPI